MKDLRSMRYSQRALCCVLLLSLAQSTSGVCSDGSSSQAGSETCSCNVGYRGPDSGPCVAYVVDTYKGIAGTDVCQTCATYKTTAAECECRPMCV